MRCTKAKQRSSPFGKLELVRHKHAEQAGHFLNRDTTIIGNATRSSK